jgi:hypothetical protein
MSLCWQRQDYWESLTLGGCLAAVVAEEEKKDILMTDTHTF